MDNAAVVVLDVVLVLEVVLVVLGVIVVTVNGGSASQIKNVECAAFVLVEIESPNPPSQLQYVELLVVLRSHNVTETAVVLVVLVVDCAIDGVVADALNVVPLILIRS